MLERLRTQILPEAVQAQAFGADVNKFVSFELTEPEANPGMGSEIYFGDITVQKDTGKLQTESVFIKVKPLNPVKTFNLVKNPDADFPNELLFNSKIVPLFRKYDTDNILSKNFSEFIYGKAATNGQNQQDVLIFKNLSKKGFRLSDEKVLLDEKHLKLALDRIAKFHAISLKCQWDDPEAFQEVAAQIEGVFRTKPEENAFFKDFLKQNCFRGINALKENPEYKDRLADISAHCENAVYWIQKYMAPSEPLSVITHGDLVRNNMMFKYESNGDPIEVVFYDLAYIKFCSPTIDTNYLLMMNTSPETRRLHWDEFLHTYYDTLSGQLDGYPVKTSAQTTELSRYSTKPSLESVRLDWRTKGIYGYYLTSCFQPVCMTSRSYWRNREEEKSKTDPDTNPLEIYFNIGGAKATEYLAEVVKHMLDNRYIFEH